MRLRAQIVVVSLISLVGLALLAGLEFKRATAEISAADDVVATVELAVPLGDLVNALRIERGMSAGFIASGGRTFADAPVRQRRAVDTAIRALERHVTDVDAVRGRTLDRVISAANTATSLRSRVSGLEITVPGVAAAYTSAVRTCPLEQRQTLPRLRRGISAKVGTGWLALSEAAEAAGRERAMGATGLGAGGFTSAVLQNFLRLGAIQTMRIAEG